MQSIDNGENWAPSNNGIIGTTVNGIAFSEDGTLWGAVEFQGIRYSPDGGEHWHSTDLPEVRLGALVANNADGAVIAAIQGALWRSEDNGAHWELLAEIPEMEAEEITSLAFHPDGSIYAGTYPYGFVFRYEDGQGWQKKSLGLPSSSVGIGVLGMAISPNGTIAAGRDDGIFRSVSNGHTWVSSSLTDWEASIRCMATDEDGTMYAGTYYGSSVIYRSLDGGQSWETLIDLGEALGADGSINVLLLAGPQDIFAATTGGIYHSADNGGSWAPLNDGLAMELNPLEGVRSIGMGPDGRLYAGVHSRGLFRSSSLISALENGPVYASEPLTLRQNFPNPFHTATTIPFELAERSRISLKVFNAQGQEVATLLEETLPAGPHEANFNAHGLAPGVYFCRLEAGNAIQVSKVAVGK